MPAMQLTLPTKAIITPQCNLLLKVLETPHPLCLLIVLTSKVESGECIQWQDLESEDIRRTTQRKM